MSDVVLERVGSGYELVDPPASGPMDRDAAVTATIADAGAKSGLLERSGYLEGYSRVWTKRDDYVTILVYDFSGERGSRALVSFELKQLARTAGSVPFKVDEIPNARGYILSAVERADGDPLFCQGVWFPVATRAFAVNTCGKQPNAATLAVDLAVRQWRRAR